MIKWIYECLNILIKEPTEENRKIVAKTIANEIEDKENYMLDIIKDCYFEANSELSDETVVKIESLVGKDKLKEMFT